jgi:signal transduction histidine kinase
LIPAWARLRSWALSVPIRIKIMGIAVGIVLLLGLGVTLEVRSSLRATVEMELKRRAAAIARDVAGRAADLIATNDLFALHQLVRTTLEHDGDTRYVLVVDASGEILAHTLTDNPSYDLVQANLPSGDETAHLRVLDTDEGRIYDAAVPIFRGLAGVARVGMSDRRAGDIVGATTRRLLGVTGLISLAGVAAALLLTFELTRPLLALGRVAEAVGRGEFLRKAPVWSRDELGRLTEAFNAMTEALDRSHRQLLRRNAELSALNAIGVTVSASLRLQEVLEGALAKVLELMNLRAGWILLQDGGGPVLAASVGVSPGAAEEQVADASVPLKAKERVLGVMNVVTGENGPPGEQDLNLLHAIGHQIALAIENARLYEEVERKEEIRRRLLDKVITAQEEERRRLSRELHDEVGQGLTALIMNLDSAEATIPPQLDTLKRDLRGMREQLAATLEEIRRLMVDLRPALLDDLGLVPAIQSFMVAHLDRAAIKHRLEVAGRRRRLPPSAETALFRIVQEAVTNIIRHSGAHRAGIRLEFQDDSVAAEIWDDGKGFDPQQVRKRLGLLGMEERVGFLGGRWSIRTQAGHGTRISLEIPLMGPNGKDQAPDRG